MTFAMSYAANKVGIAALALLGLGVGCASPNVYVRPTPAQIAAAEDAVRTARARGADTDPAAAPFLSAAERQLASGRHSLDLGDNYAATWLLARAAADGELSHALAEKSRQEAEAKTTEDQLARTRAEAARPTQPPASN
jgi:hypothetical protein